ncbi:MAG: hypothetical protein QOD03_589 [Verrucomicrobiota bacterium]|jgi:hypothetical protein
MKKIYSLLALAGLVIGLATPAFAADKEVTVTGEGKCGKCSLKETDKCQNVIQTEENGKKVTYYLEGKESKAFHENLCKESHKVTATGTVKEEDGKKVMHVAKIELAN